MKVVTGFFQVTTEGEDDVVDLTGQVKSKVDEAGVASGAATIFVSGSTAAVTTMEYEPGLVDDFPAMLERVAPRSHTYKHERAWHDGNGRSHVKASLVGPSLTVPVVEGRLALGTWQQVVLVELDIRARRREILVQVIGE